MSFLPAILASYVARGGYLLIKDQLREAVSQKTAQAFSHSGYLHVHGRSANTEAPHRAHVQKIMYSPCPSEWARESSCGCSGVCPTFFMPSADAIGLGSCI